MVKQIITNQKAEVAIRKSTDPTLVLLESLISRSNIEEAILSFRKELGQAVEDYSVNPIGATMDKIMRLLKDSFIFHIICKQSFNTGLLDARELSNYSNCLDFSESGLKAILSAFQLWIKGKNEGIPYSIIFEFARLNEKEFQDASIFLSYELSIGNSEFRRELLYAHYLLVRKVANDFRSIFGQENLNDDVLESLFKTSLVLFYCGYSSSLRLPKEEAATYTTDVIKRESIERSFKEAFGEAGKVSISQTHVKIRISLWVLSTVDLILLIIHWIHEIYVPIELAPFGLKLTFEQIPIFLFVAIIVTAILLSYLYRLESSITKKLRRGKIGS